MALAVNPEWDASFNNNAGACFNTVDNSRIDNQLCCDLGLNDGSCPVYTYAADSNTCTVLPYDPNQMFFQYSTDIDDCCMAYNNDGDESLLEACADPVMETLCTQEVFEPKSMVCDSVSSERQVYRTMNGGDVGAITYASSHTDSSPLRCCIAMDEWMQNPMACTSIDEDEFKYVWNDEESSCVQERCTRTNLYLPYDGMRDLVLALAGDTCVF